VTSGRRRTAALAGLLAAVAAATEPAGGSDLAYLDFPCPPGHEPLVDDRFHPTRRCWRFRNDGDLAIVTTRRSVGADSAMAIVTEHGDEPGEILVYDVAVRGEHLRTHRGISFWMRGDGGEGSLRIGTGWSQADPECRRAGDFPLATTAWRKHVIAWDAFVPAVTTGFYFINLRLVTPRPRPAWAVVARLSICASPEAEPIAPVDDPDPPGMIPAERFLAPPPAGIAAQIPRTLAKLRTQRPVTIAAVGDSLTAGAQLWYRPPGRTVAACYWAMLGTRLAAHFGYQRHRQVLKSWETVDKASGRTPSGLPGDGYAFAPPLPEVQPDGSLPFDGLQVVGIGAGGKDARFGLDHLADATALKPDLVIWMYGANDMIGGGPRGYAANTTAAIDALRSQGIEVLLSGTTVHCNDPYHARSVAFGQAARDRARTLGVPLADHCAALTCRGRRYLGDVLSDHVHLNEHGHRFLAATLAAAFGVPGQVVWDLPALPTATGPAAP
jgi:lysophospholipase L1-like esterase